MVMEKFWDPLRWKSRWHRRPSEYSYLYGAEGLACSAQRPPTASSCEKPCGEYPARIPSIHWTNRHTKLEIQRSWHFATRCDRLAHGKYWKLPPPPHCRWIRSN